MNKMTTNIAFMIIITVILVVFGNLFVISPMNAKIDDNMQELSSLRKDAEKLKSQMQNIPEKAAAPEEKNYLLSAGQEGQLMKLFLEKNLQERFKINTYDLYSSYFYKPEIAEQSNNMPVMEASTTEKLSQLDENGMPADAYVESEETEWPGIEVTPLKITFTAKAKGLNTALKYFWNLPVNTVRAADFIFGGDIIKGTMIFAFPLNE